MRAQHSFANSNLPVANLFSLRLKKVLFCILRPHCWRALAHGVAPSVEHREVLETVDCDLLLDVGANRGQFSLMARALHSELTIHAFEPLPTEIRVYQNLLGSRPRVTLHQHALGETAGEFTFHISGRADSSSMLPIGELQTKFFPTTGEVAQCQVQVRTLDSLTECWAFAKRALLKLDVQGYELNVLRGAKEALRHCAFVYVECSHLPLYTGQALYSEVENFLRDEGFVMRRQANEQWAGGKLVQADYLFGRSDHGAN